MPNPHPTNKELDNRVAALEGWKLVVDAKLDALQLGGTVDLSELEARLTTLENKICPHENTTDSTSFLSRILVLEEHISE